MPELSCVGVGILPFSPLIMLASSGIYGRVAIKVVDNGSGIEDEVLDKIFIPFFSTRKAAVVLA